MLHRGALYLLIVALALLASPGLTPPVAAQFTYVIDDDLQNCVDGNVPHYSTITQAVAVAVAGDTIRVCEGDYTEPSMTISDDYLTITGPGATPENDGVATVHHNGVSSAMFTIHADYVVLQGLDLDATPPWGFGGAMTIGIENHGSSVAIEHNEIRNATSAAVSVSGSPAPSAVQVLFNNIHDNTDAVVCYCDDSDVAGNTVNVTDRALELVGDGGNVTNNVFVNGRVVANGDDLFISTNQISGPGVSPLLSVSGSRVGVTDNTLSDAAGYGIQAQPGSTSTSVTIGRNTFTNINRPIRLQDSNPGDAFTLTATIGGSQAEANTFVESGGTLGDSNYLVQMDGPTIDVNAEYNK
jgi:hypothetical protein